MAYIPVPFEEQSSLFDDPPLTIRGRMLLAHHEHHRRQSGAFIAGTIDGRVWTPHPDEQMPCCQGEKRRREEFRQQFPLHWKKHCCTYRHIAVLYDIDEKDFRAFCRQRDKE